jgi:hypothetical protein
MISHGWLTPVSTAALVFMFSLLVGDARLSLPAYG